MRKERKSRRGIHYRLWPWHCEKCREGFENDCRWMRQKQRGVEGGRNTHYISRLRKYLTAEKKRFNDRLRFDSHKVWDWNRKDRRGGR